MINVSDSNWKCPKCGAGWAVHARDLCCYCDGETDDDHGTSLANPCFEARCNRCKWNGTLPVDAKPVPEYVAQLERERDEALTSLSTAREAEQRMRDALTLIIVTDTHGINAPDEHGVLRPTGTDFCGRCNRNSYWTHSDDCPITKARAALAPDAKQDDEGKGAR